MKRLVILFGIFVSLNIQAQNPQDNFDFETPDLDYLEYLTFQEINALRTAKGRTALRPDSILLQAAEDHAMYMKETGRQSHFQKGNKPKADPQLRIEYFGAIHVLAGENILYIPAEKDLNVTIGKRSEPLHTYEDFAKAMALIWKLSKPHYGNILSPDFSIAALAISYNKSNGSLYGVQVFGQVTGEHILTQSAEDFPHYTEENFEKKK